jgi:hypothetical protein
VVTSLGRLRFRMHEASQRLDPSLLSLAALSLAVLVLRIPSFFEPPWHTDEGTFAAVAQNILHGQQLYAEAWESKPPLFLYLYAAVFKVFGPGVFGLRLAATASAIATHVVLYFIGRRLELSHRQSLLAAGSLGFLLGVPFWEGTLALTEVFTILPTALAILVVLVWQARVGTGSDRAYLLFLAGVLFVVAFLFRQTSALAAAAAGLWLLFSGGPWLRANLLLAVGFVLAVLPVVAAFALLGDFYWFWDANVGFFFAYVPSGDDLSFAARPIIVLPTFLTLACLLYYRRAGALPRWGLPMLWLAFTLAGALLTGRSYSHYMLQSFPPLALLIAIAAPHARLSWRPEKRHAPALALAGSLVLMWAVVVTPMFAGSPLAMRYTRGPSYYVNFSAWTLGLRTTWDYNNYFDRRVNPTLRLAEMLRGLEAQGERVYIWGEYPWIYALANVDPVTRYPTSFYVLLIPYVDVQLGEMLEKERPAYIIVMSDARPAYPPRNEVLDRRYRNAVKAIDSVVSRDYRRIAVTDKAEVYERKGSGGGPGIIGALP